MRIGVDIRGLLTGQISGVEQYALQLLRSLLAIDQHNTYVLFYVSYRDLDQKLDDLLVQYPWLQASNIEVKKLRWVNFPLLLHAVFKPLNWPKIDIIADGLDVMFMPSPRLLPLSSRCAKVTTFHDLVFMIYPQFYTLSSRIWQWQMNYRFEARSSDAIIAVSQNTKQDIVRLLDIKSDKIAVIYEGVGEEYFVPPPDVVIRDLKHKFNIADEYIYYVGSIEPRKNLKAVIHALVRLAKEHSDTIKLVISGSKDWLSSDLYQLVDQLQLQDRVIFTGRVTEEEKIALLNSATLFVFPSLYEGFGLMVLEAFAAGCPVIASNVSSLPEVAGNAAILVSPDDVNELAKQIHRVGHDQDLRDQLVSRGKARAREFTWKQTAQKTLQVIERAVKTHGG